MIFAGESFRGIGGILSASLSVKSYALLFFERSLEVMDVNDTLTPDMVEEVTLRSDLRPLSEVVEATAAAEVVGVVVDDVDFSEAAEVTKGTEVTTTELLGASLPFSSILAENLKNSSNCNINQKSLRVYLSVLFFRKKKEKLPHTGAKHVFFIKKNNFSFNKEL